MSQHRGLDEHVAQAGGGARPGQDLQEAPSAARRSANGSREPVGFSPIEKKATSVSSRSAILTATVTGVGRHLVALAGGLVMVADRVGDRGGLPLGARIIAADHALQLGEFADHLGDEIGLGEPGGAADLCEVGAG